ncbi:hypothetical protein GQ53DRAFT_473843 [Thozetella sp. PMI_491]|nr:hypothetical protein GQ53DRAFT_473843 [Thozetella sp. PMI_491]
MDNETRYAPHSSSRRLLLPSSIQYVMQEEPTCSDHSDDSAPKRAPSHALAAVLTGALAQVAPRLAAPRTASATCRGTHTPHTHIRTHVRTNGKHAQGRGEGTGFTLDSFLLSCRPASRQTTYLLLVCAGGIVRVLSETEGCLNGGELQAEEAWGHSCSQCSGKRGKGGQTGPTRRLRI